MRVKDTQVTQNTKCYRDLRVKYEILNYLGVGMSATIATRIDIFNSLVFCFSPELVPTLFVSKPSKYKGYHGTV